MDAFPAAPSTVLSARQTSELLSLSSLTFFMHWSMVNCASMNVPSTSLVCPMRCTRSKACSCTWGLNQRSRNTTTLARVMLRPVPPECTVHNSTSASPFFWKRSSTSLRSSAEMSPSKRSVDTCVRRGSRARVERARAAPRRASRGGAGRQLRVAVLAALEHALREVQGALEEAEKHHGAAVGHRVAHLLHRGLELARGAEAAEALLAVERAVGHLRAPREVQAARARRAGQQPARAARVDHVARVGDQAVGAGHQGLARGHLGARGLLGQLVVVRIVRVVGVEVDDLGRLGAPGHVLRGLGAAGGLDVPALAQDVVLRRVVGRRGDRLVAHDALGLVPLADLLHLAARRAEVLGELAAVAREHRVDHAEPHERPDRQEHLEEVALLLLILPRVAELGELLEQLQGRRLERNVAVDLDARRRDDVLRDVAPRQLLRERALVAPDQVPRPPRGDHALRGPALGRVRLLLADLAPPLGRGRGVARVPEAAEGRHVLGPVVVGRARRADAPQGRVARERGREAPLAHGVPQEVGLVDEERERRRFRARHLGLALGLDVLDVLVVREVDHGVGRRGRRALGGPEEVLGDEAPRGVRRLLALLPERVLLAAAGLAVAVAVDGHEVRQKGPDAREEGRHHGRLRVHVRVRGGLDLRHEREAREEHVLRLAVLDLLVEELHALEEGAAAVLEDRVLVLHDAVEQVLAPLLEHRRVRGDDERRKVLGRVLLGRGDALPERRAQQALDGLAEAHDVREEHAPLREGRRRD
mmetsp:Transcript_27614/g.82872  ORF Transcript_27614/g.82872 Transcript_27614/m.82872 type:complete len:761 (+) Transcript_27614:351-2633(+)